MSRTILCSTGTSIAQGCQALSAFQNRPSDWDEDTTELNDQITQRLSKLDLDLEQGRVRASAELNALHRLGAGGEDEVILFTTDTADGHCCAKAIASVLEKKFRIGGTKIERIEGLQVRDAAKLQRVGLVSLTRRLVHYLDDPQRRYGGGCVLNTNGGFKGLVPFFAILGMIYRAPVVYVFEFAECLISLPPLPVGFATDLFDRALPAIRWADTVQQFDPEEFYRRIPRLEDGEREWFASFLEVVSLDGQNIGGLSPLVQVLSQRESGPTAVLSISRLAQHDIDELTGSELRDVHDHLRKLSSPLWRIQHRDTKYNSDLDFFPKGHNPWRFAGYSTPDGFKLCWFARHGAYERLMAQKDRQKDAFSEFLPFTVPSPASKSPEIAESDPDFHRDWNELRDELLGLRGEAETLRTTNQEHLTTITQERKKLRMRDAQNSKLQEQIWKLERKIQDMQRHSNAGDRTSGAHAQPDDLQALVGTTVEATYAGVKGKSHRFTFNHRNDSLTACVPLDRLAEPLAPGDLTSLVFVNHKSSLDRLPGPLTVGDHIQISLTGLSNRLFQADLPN